MKVLSTRNIIFIFIFAQKYLFPYLFQKHQPFRLHLYPNFTLFVFYQCGNKCQVCGDFTMQLTPPSMFIFAIWPPSAPYLGDALFPASLCLVLCIATYLIWIWLFLTFYNSIISQWGRVWAMPGEVGINLSSHHSCFLLLSACLIKLSPSPMHMQHHFSINFSVSPSVPSSPQV